jgi:hypothetical protein
MTLYPKEVILILCDWMDDDINARDWLKKNNYEELVELKDAVRRFAKSFEYLLTNKHMALAAFVNAVWEDKNAFQMLLEKKEVHWAAMANYINGDEKAALFLKKNGLEHYAKLAHKIMMKIQEDNNAGSTIFNSGPYKL